VNVPVEIDEKLLTEMSDLTGGKYFRATNKNKLKSIFEEIDKLEKTKIEVLSFEQRSEEYKLWVLLALICLCLELFGRYVYFKTLP
ncbi:MAG: aerotolerance regulator BatA, partial [Bacteroidales bacterium]|nr:aerotolerance regulator BatA [Bacteroidales bacterium]